MRTIRDVKKVIRVETGDGVFLDFDPDNYFGDSDAHYHFRTMSEENKNPRMYRGTITTELEEVE